MDTLQFTVEIQADPQRVWKVLWSDASYRKWTAAFHEGSYAESDWREGSPVRFLTPEGMGMYSVIETCQPPKKMVFRHLGNIKDFKEQPEDEETKKWSGAKERYELEPVGGGTRLVATLDTTAAFADYFTATFPKALGLVKQLAEEEAL